MKIEQRRDTLDFLVKILLLSALLSAVIKYGGPLLPVVAPFTERLNTLVTAIVVLPSLLISAVLLALLKLPPSKS
jgi:hypothetical protein